MIAGQAQVSCNRGDIWLQEIIESDKVLEQTLNEQEGEYKRGQRQWFRIGDEAIDSVIRVLGGSKQMEAPV